MKKTKECTRTSITLPIILFNDFRAYCKKKGFKISTKIASLIREELNKNGEVK